MVGWFTTAPAHLTNPTCSHWSYFEQCRRYWNISIGRMLPWPTELMLRVTKIKPKFFCDTFQPQNSVCTALIRSDLTSQVFRHQLLADTVFGKLPKQLLLLTTDERVYHFVIDNIIPGSPAFDPPLLLLSEATDAASKHVGSCISKAWSKSHHRPRCCRLDEWKEREVVLLLIPSGGVSSLLILQPAGAVAKGIVITSGNMANCPYMETYWEYWPWTCCSICCSFRYIFTLYIRPEETFYQNSSLIFAENPQLVSILYIRCPTR